MPSTTIRIGGCLSLSRNDAQLLLRDGHAERLVAVREVEPDGVDLARQERMEPQPVAAHLESEVAARDEVDGSGHRGDVHALARGAALDVVEVAAEGLPEEPP